MAALDPGRSLVLRGGIPIGRSPSPFDFTWTFCLIPQGERSVRLLVRERWTYLRWWIPLLVRPVGVVSVLMHHGMLRGIAERAERQR